MNGTADGAEKQLIYIQTRMNSYEPNLLCKRPRMLIVPGESMDYMINVTNDGKLQDTIDIVYSTPSTGWTVDLYYFDTGVELIDWDGDTIPDTNVIAPGNFRVIRAEVTAPSAAQKYHQELIYINASTNTDPDGTVYVAPQITVSTVVDLAFCISDNANNGSDKYYETGEFTGHNVNSGMMTSYVIDIFNVSTDQKDTTLSIDYTSDSSWQAVLEYGASSGNSVVVPAPSTVGDYYTTFLNITAPDIVDTGYEFIVNVTADEGTSSGVDDHINVTTRVIAEKKVYLIVFNGINNMSVDLNMNYGLYTGSGERLWPNLWKLIDYGSSKYNYTIDVLPAFADSDWTSVLTSSYPGTNGIHGVGAYVSGFNDTTDIIEGDWYHHDNIHVNTVFNTIKSCNPNIRTAAIGGKNFTIDMIADEDVDISVTPYKRPYYVPEPEPYKMGNIYYGTGLQEWMLLNIPSDGWVFNATMSVIAHEDPDFIFIENIESDSAGHLYGSEVDGTPTYQRDYINELAQPQYTRDVVHDLDMHLGRFMDYMENRKGLDQNNALNESLVVISADHGMKTYWAPPNTTVDPREILENENIIMGKDYKYCLGGGAPAAFIYNFTTKTKRDTAKSVLENYTDAEDENPIWKVLDFEGMNGSSDHYPSAGQPYGLYDELMAEQGIGGLFPELIVLTHARYQIPYYSDTWFGTSKTFMFERTSPIWWEEGNLTVLVGNHATYDEQLVPLIIHGPGIKQGYFNDTRIEALDIIPTICEFNGWKNPAWPEDGYFEDHEAEGEVLSDCLESRTVTNLDKGSWYYVIQDAINDADSGQSIKVYSGIYNEHLVINKKLNLVGETKGIPNYWGYSGQRSILDGGGTGTVINISADDVYIEGFEIRNGDIGIHINQTDSVEIAYNTISNHNFKGLFMDHATDTEISHSRIIYNLDIGSHAYYSEGKGFYYNEIAWNNVGLKYEQSSVSKCSNHNWYHDNTIGIDYDPTEELPPLLIDSNVFENNTAAINITAGINITLSNNTIFNNEYGISIFNSNNISMIDNDIHDNTYHGIYIDSVSHNNTLYHNNLQNTYNAYDYGTDNQWDNGIEGNWWSDNPYPTDANGDGICEQPYSGTAFTDNYPLANEDNDRVRVGTVSFWFIQSAINFAEENDMLYVDIGDYYESVTVGKTLTAIGDMTFLRGNLTIQTGSSLTLQDSNLIMNCSFDGEYTIKVDGTLHLIDSIVSSYNPQYRYILTGGGQLIIENSDFRDVHPDSTFGMTESNIWYGEPLVEYATLELQFPSGGGEKIAYLKLPKTSDTLYASLDLTGEISGSSYPTNSTIDVGDDGFEEWSYFGELSSGVSITDLNTTPIFAISVQDYLDSNQPDEFGYIYTPVSFSSDSEGKLVISNVNITYPYRWTSGIFSKDHYHSSCYYHKFTVDIYYTYTGGIRIDDNYCPNIGYTVTIAEPNWDKPATVKHHYYDEDNNGIVDGTSIPEFTLTMYWWDESNQSWESTSDVFGEDNTGVNALDNYVWSNVDHFSNFTINGSYVPIAETEALIDTLEEMEIQQGVKNSLKAKLEAALSYLNEAQDHFVNGDLDWGNENLTLAKNKLVDFINEVEAQRGKAICEQDAIILIDEAEEIIGLIDEAYV